MAALKRFNIEEKSLEIEKKRVVVKTKEDLINAALIILRKKQLDYFEQNEELRKKKEALNSEFKKRPTFKLLNVVNVWIKGKRSE
jgi:hypothetical protein